MLLFLGSFLSYAQYVATSSSSYNGDIYHIGGNLGIGTTSPSKLLELYSDIPTVLRFTARQEGDACKTLEHFYWDIQNDKNLTFWSQYTKCGDLTPYLKVMELTYKGQVYIGKGDVSESAVFQIDSRDKGILIPRLTSEEIKNISSPVNSLLVFNTDNNRFMYFLDGQWITISASEDVAENFLTKTEFYSTVASGIKSEDTAKWNEAYSWGNHAEAGYLTEETDPVFSAWDKNYYDLTNRPDFSGWDTVAADDFDGHWSSLQGTPPGVSIFPNDAGYLTDADLEQIWKQNNSYVYLPNIGFKVGIGTRTPESKLHLKAPYSRTLSLRLESKLFQNGGNDKITDDNDTIIHKNRGLTSDISSFWDIKKIGADLGFYYNNTQNPLLKIKPGDNPNIYLKGTLNVTGQAPYWTDAHWRKRLVVPLGSAWVSSNKVNDEYNLGFGITTTGWYFIEGKDNGQLRYPAYLQTNGTFVCSKVKVIELPQWHDDVFDPDYNLMPINELEQYLLQNRHLPDIPCEDSLKQNGLDLSQMQALQMKKIEELTLYIIQLNQRLTQLEYENKLLKQKLNLQNQTKE